MDAISVVIITKNEAANIKACIDSAGLISTDIIVIDAESTDNTVEIAKACKANVHIVPWAGFGNARNTAASLAQHNWILAIDADERVTPALAEAIKQLDPANSLIMYGFKRQNYFLGKKIRFGEWGRDKVFRLYNRQYIAWDLSSVHEVLIGENSTKKLINGYINHYPVTLKQQDRDKTLKYAQLNAQKLYQKGKKATFIKRFLAPVFNFLQTYIFRLGFLDGKQGFVIAVSTSRYVWLKYKLLHKMWL